MNHCGECYYWQSGTCLLDNNWVQSGQMPCRQFRKDKKKKHTLNNGIPECPDCGGKDMCDKHNVELLKYEAETARKEYEEAKKEYERKQNENL